MTAIEEISTICDEDTVADLNEHIAFLNGKIEAQQTNFREQLTELRSSVNELQQENQSLKAENQQLVREKREIVEQAESNKVLLEKIDKLNQEKVALQGLLDNFRLEETESSQSQKNLTPTCWKSTCSKVSVGHTQRMIDVLDVPLPNLGVHQWEIKIVREEGVRLGVVLAHETKYRDSLGETGSTSWGYGGCGDAWHNNCMVGGHHVGFGHGSVVTLRLDLTGQGALSVGVDGKPLIEVFKNMKNGHTQKFIPAAYLWNKSEVEFLGYKHE